MFEEGIKALTQPAVHQKPIPWITEVSLYNSSSHVCRIVHLRNKWGWERGVSGAWEEISTATILNLILGCEEPELQSVGASLYSRY